MKLISLNIEGKKHLDRVRPFLESEQPDIICLQEAPEDMQDWLTERNYQVTFTSMLLRTQDTETFAEGIVFASVLPHTPDVHYYYGNSLDIQPYDPDRRRESIAHAVILAQLGEHTIATTHLPAPVHGEQFYEPLATDITALRAYLAPLGSHILIGDMNTPRSINPSHKNLVAGYIDHIPDSYASSLDRDLHRLGNKPEKKHLFDTFMVDYLLTTPGYSVRDVRLQFGLSDHAAIVATIEALARG